MLDRDLNKIFIFDIAIKAFHYTKNLVYLYDVKTVIMSPLGRNDLVQQK